jgi:dihydroxyacid dehydratase/phosphogluconate dehydratase
MGKPVVAVVASYHSGLPCNNRFNEFAELIALELERLGAKAMISYTPVISDGMT